MDIILDDHLCFKLYVASRLIVQNFAAPMAKFDLTYPKYLVLSALGEHNGLTVTELGERLSLDSGTLSPLLKALTAAKFVRRVRSNRDVRLVHNHLTASGRRAREGAMLAAYDVFCRTNMPADEFEMMRICLDGFIHRCERLIAEGNPTAAPRLSILS